MIKTHPESRIVLRTTEQVYDSTDCILQAEKTDAKQAGTGKDIYICEVVSIYKYKPEKALENLTAELVKVNDENRKLRRKVEQLQRKRA